MKLLNPLEGSVLKLWPEGNIRQLYGANPGLYGGLGHPGIDIAKARGTNVLAAHDGTVQIAQADPVYRSYGNFVLLQSESIDGVEYLTQYGHLLDITATVGEYVKAGSIIGHEGNTGFVVSDGGASKWWGNAPDNKGNHLHFNLFKYVNKVLVRGLSGMSTIDPMPYFDAMFEVFSTGDKKQWAVFQGRRYWILDPETRANGNDKLWKDTLSYDPSVLSLPYGGAIFLSNTDDPSQ